VAIVSLNLCRGISSHAYVKKSEMHEFSLAGEVIRLARYEAEKNNAIAVSEITIEIGNLNGVEVDAFESALGILAEKTILEKSLINIVRINGRGICPVCKREFEMNRRIDTCPECHELPSEIKGGKEFRVLSLLIEKE
jgi:hydrogenase nickel incorporation protein HypA/HybF